MQSIIARNDVIFLAAAATPPKAGKRRPRRASLDDRSIQDFIYQALKIGVY
jgi:hypothetical protein